MARSLSGTGQYYTANTGFGLTTSDPVSMVVLGAVDDFSAASIPAALGLTSGSLNQRRIQIETTQVVNAREDGGSGSNSQAQTAYTLTTHQLIIAQFLTTTLRSIQVENNAAVQNTGAQTLGAAPTHFRVGATMSAGGPWDGPLKYVALYHGGLTADSCKGLYARWHPTLIQPDDLIEVLDLNGRNTERGWKGTAFTVTGSPTFADNPRLYLPRRRSSILVPSTSGVSGDVAATASTATASASGTPVVAGTGQPVASTATAATSGTSAVGGTAAATAPTGIAAAAGTPVVTGSASPEASEAQAAASGASAVSGSAAAQGEQATGAAAGTPIVTGGATAEGQAPTVIASDEQDAIGTVDAEAPAGEATAAGAPIVTGTGQAAAGPGQAAAQGASRVTGQVDATAEPPTASSAGTAAITGAVAVTAQAPTVSASDMVELTYTTILVAAARAGTASIAARAGRTSIAARSHLSE